MRNTQLSTLGAGLALAVAAAVAMTLSAVLDLRLAPAALVGLALGAVVALVPDRSAGLRLAGLLAGLVIGWIGYLVRAAALPDTDLGRTVFLVVVVLLCTAAATLSVGRLPLWSVLLGAAALGGVYETVFAAAPQEAGSASLSAVTSVLLTAGLGFLAVSLVLPAASGSLEASSASRGRHGLDPTEGDPAPNDEDRGPLTVGTTWAPLGRDGEARR